jgi:hypothetical protein
MSRMKLIGRYGNGIGALFFLSLALYALRHGDILVALCWMLVCGLACFNICIFEKAAGLTSAQERLNKETRTAQLRRKPSGPGMETPEAVLRNHGA